MSARSCPRCGGGRGPSPRTRRAAGLGLLLVAVGAAGCAGGPPPELGVGCRVRVRVDEKPRAWVADGFLLAVTADSLVLDPVGPGRRLAIPRRALGSLEVHGASASDEQALDTAWELGRAAGSLAVHDPEADDEDEDDEEDHESIAEFAAGIVGGVVVGGVTRLVVGDPANKWHEVPLSFLDALIRARDDGPVTVSLPGPDSEGPGVEPRSDPDSIPDLDSGSDQGP